MNHSKAASDGIGDGLERFARGEKMKLTDQKEMYRKRVQVIWERQRAVLSADAPIGTSGVDAGNGDVAAATGSAIEEKKKESDKEDSESDSDDDDFAADFEEDIMDARQTNQIVAGYVRGDMGDGSGLDKQRTADLSKDARELAAFKRQREEERAAKEGLLSAKVGTAGAAPAAAMVGRKVVRRRITKTYPDGRQTVTFKFIVAPILVGQVIDRKEQGDEDDEERKSRAIRHERGPDEKPLGHAFYEEDDDFDHFSKSRGPGHRKPRTSNGPRKKGTPVAKAPPRIKSRLHIGKLKTKVSKEQRMKKRKREEEEAELYVATAKRMGTSNRRERGSIRERMPHVILADKMEVIRAAVEKRPSSGAFHKPVNRRTLPTYYEIISNPIDLQTIREKNARCVSLSSWTSQSCRKLILWLAWKNLDSNIVPRNLFFVTLS